VVREQGALGKAGRARRVLDVDRVARPERRLTLGELAVSDAPARGQERIPVVSEHDRDAQLGAAAAHLLEHRHIVGLAEAAGHHQHAHARLAQRVLELGRLVGGVDRHQDPADARGRELRHDPLVTIRSPDPDAVTLAHAVRHERARGRVHLPPQLAIGRPVALVGHHERLAFAEALDRPAQVLADRLLQQRDVARPARVGHVCRRGDRIGGRAADLGVGARLHGRSSSSERGVGKEGSFTRPRRRRVRAAGGARPTGRGAPSRRRMPSRRTSGPSPSRCRSRRRPGGSPGGGRGRDPRSGARAGQPRPRPLAVSKVVHARCRSFLFGLV
jgi:hypothetical protein